MYKFKNVDLDIAKKISLELVQKLLILFFIAHGIAHLVGTLIYWKMMPGTQDVPYKTTLFFGYFEIGALGASVLGLIYLVLAFLFVIVGMALLVNKLTFESNLVIMIIMLSMLLTLLDLTQTYIWFIINIFYLSVIFINKKVKFL